MRPDAARSISSFAPGMNDDDSRIQQLGGGSLLIAWQLRNKRVLIVGGGEVASQRIESILTADAFITVVSPEQGLHPRTKRFIEIRQDRITYHNRSYEGPEDLENIDMVLTALDNNELSREIVDLCRQNRIPVNAADIPDLCDFYFGAQIRDGPLQIMISTNGNGPRMASLIKTRLQKGLSGVEGEALLKVGQLRNKLKKRAPGVGGQLGRERMKWMSGVCNKWNMEDFSALDEPQMDRLLDDGWEKDRRVPTAKEIGIRPTKQISFALWDSVTIFPMSFSFLAGVVVTSLLFSHSAKR